MRQLNAEEQRVADRLTALTDDEFREWSTKRHPPDPSVNYAMVYMYELRRRDMIKPAPLPTARVVKR